MKTKIYDRTLNIELPPKRVHRGITVIPWREFLQDLWGGEIIG
jgi:hypothetical protein